jgi:hypothetical protein
MQFRQRGIDERSGAEKACLRSKQDIETAVARRALQKPPRADASHAGDGDGRSAVPAPIGQDRSVIATTRLAALAARLGGLLAVVGEIAGIVLSSLTLSALAARLGGALAIVGEVTGIVFLALTLTALAGDLTLLCLVHRCEAAA